MFYHGLGKLLKILQTLKGLVPSSMGDNFKSVDLLGQPLNLPLFSGYELMKILVVRYSRTLFLSNGKEYLLVTNKWYLHGPGVAITQSYHQCFAVRISPGQGNLEHKAWGGLFFPCQTLIHQKSYEDAVTYHASWKRDHKWCSVNATACLVLFDVFLRILME